MPIVPGVATSSRTGSTRRYINGGTVRRLRDAYGIQQQQLALDCELHPAYLSNIESGKKQPSPPVMKRIADRLGVDLDDITYVVPAEQAS